MNHIELKNKSIEDVKEGIEYDLMKWSSLDLPVEELRHLKENVKNGWLVNTETIVELSKYVASKRVEALEILDDKITKKLQDESWVKYKESCPPKREIVQITSGSTTEGNEVLTALCNDGTIWQIVESYKEHATWDKIKSIPQN
jgi:hypothetical protein